MGAFGLVISLIFGLKNFLPFGGFPKGLGGVGGRCPSRNPIGLEGNLFNPLWALFWGRCGGKFNLIKELGVGKPLWALFGIWAKETLFFLGRPGKFIYGKGGGRFQGIKLGWGLKLGPGQIKLRGKKGKVPRVCSPLLKEKKAFLGKGKGFKHQRGPQAKGR